MYNVTAALYKPCKVGIWLCSDVGSLGGGEVTWCREHVACT